MSSPKLKILFLTKYSRNAGSSRLRSFQYVPFLEKAGFAVEVSPLFSQNYLVQLYAGKSTVKEALIGYMKRFQKLFTLRKYNKIVIEKELFPYLPAFAEKILTLCGVRYIVDYDDAIFHNYDQSTNFIIRKFLGKKIDTVMKNAAVVVAGNSYLAERAKKTGAKNIQIIPTVIDLERYPETFPAEVKPLILGWIGTKSTFEKHVFPLMSWFQKAVDENNIEFHLIGVEPDQHYGEKIMFFPWQEDTEVAMIQNFAVGIMPLQDSLWEKGKCSYKLIQYMACEKPVIASPVGMNREVVKEGINGFTATDEKEWLTSIKTLMENDELRKAFGRAGRQSVEEQFAIQVTSEKWVEILSRKQSQNG